MGFRAVLVCNQSLSLVLSDPMTDEESAFLSALSTFLLTNDDLPCSGGTSVKFPRPKEVERTSSSMTPCLSPVKSKSHDITYLFSKRWNYNSEYRRWTCDRVYLNHHWLKKIKCLISSENTKEIKVLINNLTWKYWSRIVEWGWNKMNNVQEVINLWG